MKVRKAVLGVFLGIILLIGIVPFLIPVPPLKNTEAISSLADPDSQFIEVNGISVHYKQMGSGEPVLILLHGFGASLFSWRDVMEPLSRYGTVIAYDRPAFGLTERPMLGDWSNGNPYSMDAQVDLLFGLMDQLEIEKAILIGNSAGGGVAAAAALKSPLRVEGLVFVDAAIYGNGRFPAWTMPILRSPQMNHLGPLFVRSIQKSGEELITTAWHDPSKITEEIRDGYRKPLYAHNWDKALWYFSVAPQPDPPIAERIGELTTPVLVVTGDDDRIIPTENSVQLSRDIPQSTLVIFKDCGHVPQEECPQAFLDAVIEFLKDNNF